MEGANSELCRETLLVSIKAGVALRVSPNRHHATNRKGNRVNSRAILSSLPANGNKPRATSVNQLRIMENIVLTMTAYLVHYESIKISARGAFTLEQKKIIERASATNK